MSEFVLVKRELLERLDGEQISIATPKFWRAWEELRAVLAQEAGKCEPDALSKGFYTTESGGGKYSIAIGYRTLEEMHAADQQLRDLLRSRTSPPAPVSVVLPNVAHDKAYRNGLMQGYNLALNGSENEYQDAVTRYSKHEE